MKQIRLFSPSLPVFFIKVPSKFTQELTESAQEEAKVKELTEARSILFEQLCDIGYLSREPLKSDSTDEESSSGENESTKSIIEGVMPKSTIIEDFSLFPCFLLFVRQVLQYHIIAAACVLNDAHTLCLGMFINVAFDMARDISITPKRIVYARAKEDELFRSLMDIANRKQEEIRDVIHGTIESLAPRLQEEAAHLQFVNVELTESCELMDLDDLEKCTLQVQELVLGRLNQAVAGKLISSVEYLKESFVGTLTRCLHNLEKADADFAKESPGIATVALRQVSITIFIILEAMVIE